LRIGVKRIRAALTSRLLAIRHTVRNWRAVRTGTCHEQILFHQELKQLLRCDGEWLRATALEYYHCPSAWRRLSSYRSPSRETDDFAKTLDVAEGFAVWTLVKHLRPRVVVELGTQYGISARLWKEALKAYVPQHELILCDLTDHRRFIGDDECTFLEGDARQTLLEVFTSRKVDVLYNDVHPYDLVRWSVAEGLKQGVLVFAFHDVGCKHPRGPFRVESAHLGADEKSICAEDYGRCGTWERHVIAELFDERVLYQDTVVEASTRIQIFDSLFGLGIVIRDVKIN